MRYKGIDPDDPLQTNVLALERGRPVAGIGVGIAAVGGGIWIVRALAVGGGTTEAVVGGTEAVTGPPAGEVAAADPTPPVAPAGRVGRHARPDPD